MQLDSLVLYKEFRKVSSIVETFFVLTKVSSMIETFRIFAKSFKYN